MKFEDMKLHVPNEKKVEKKLKELTEQMKNSKTKEEAINVTKKFFRYTDEIDSDVTIISIRNSIDTTNETYKKANDKVNFVMPIISGYKVEFEKALFASPFKEDLKTKFGEFLFKQIEAEFKCFDEKITGV